MVKLKPAEYRVGHQGILVLLVIEIQVLLTHKCLRGLGGVVGLMLPLALAAAVRVPYATSPCSDLGQVVNLSLSVA